MEDPVYEPRERFEALRGERGFAARAAGLWSSGSLEALRGPCVAVVGTRAATPYGRRLAYRFAAELASAGCCIVSGLALGIDACAHEGALSVNRPTVGVLGSGHRSFFPARNLALARRMIAAGGAVVSPFAPDQPAWPSQFLQRNGIVAALADAVLVIEAPQRSGALNTAGWAAGRIPVLAVPGDVDRRHVQGCLALIRDGATLARCANDVLEAIGRVAQLPLPLERAAGDWDPLAKTLIETLGGGAASIDDLVLTSGAAAHRVLASLTALELSGIAAIDGTNVMLRQS